MMETIRWRPLTVLTIEDPVSRLWRKKNIYILLPMAQLVRAASQIIVA